MILPNILGHVNISNNSFYFAADSLYFENYGKALVSSLKARAPWAHIHVHLFNPLVDQFDWLTNHNSTYSYEYVDPLLKEIKTYYACVRFIRVPEIFTKEARVISLDADGIAVRPITEEKFISDTNVSKVLWREKHQQSLASSVLYGPDKFRFKYAKRLRQRFLNDDYQWFLDQDIMDEMIATNDVETFTDRDWGNAKIGKKTLIWSAKGDKKNNEEFQKLLQEYQT